MRVRIRLLESRILQKTTYLGPGSNIIQLQMEFFLFWLKTGISLNEKNQNLSWKSYISIFDAKFYDFSKCRFKTF